VSQDVKKIDDITFEHASGRKIYVKDITKIDISSTKVKELLKRGRSIRYLVPGGVERIIREKGLYGV